MRGIGLWFNPRNGKSTSVGHHDDWLRIPRNAAQLGLDPEVAERLSKILDNDEIRIAGVDAGLVRIRDYESYISVQFSAPRERVSSILAEVIPLLKQHRVDMYAPIHLANFALRDSAVVPGGLIELMRKLDRGETVLRETGPSDPSAQDPFVIAAMKLLETRGS